VSATRAATPPAVIAANAGVTGNGKRGTTP